MTDKELLEAAAKAAGMHIGKWVDKDVWSDDYDANIDGFVLDWRNWNPLTDDGDALRLAVKLTMNIYQEPWCVCIGDGRQTLAIENLTMRYDRDEATRRAIVRAAAAIQAGKS